MSNQTAGIREFKARLSFYVRAVKEGNTIEVTERGKVVGCFVPSGEAIRERIRQLAKSGAVQWGGKKLIARPFSARVRSSTQSVSELLMEDRK